MFCSRQSKVLLALATLFCFAIFASAQSCQVSVEQTTSSSWTSDASQFSLVQVTISNTGSSDVLAVSLDSSSAFESFWDMRSVDGQLVLPEYKPSIPAGSSHSWGYIVKSASAADLTVSSVSCDATNNNNPTQASTRRPTQAPTQRATKAPTQKPTKAPTAAPTQKSTKAPTAAPTQKATAAPTQKATAAPTQKATAAPTQKATAAPTQKATAAPTQKATAAPTQKATQKPSTGGRICPAGQVWSPTSGTTWQWQLTGSIVSTYNVQMYDIDLFDNDASVIQQLHATGRVVICYFSTQYENWRPDAASFPASTLGSNLDDWVGERFVDIRSAAVRSVMTSRLDLAVSKGCDGVEPDNVDGYTNNNGFGLTAADQINFNSFLADQAHARGLSIGLKNDLDQAAQLQPKFDWALNEQCNEYGECDLLNSFHTANKAVFGVEYTGKAATFCPKMVTAGFSWLLKSLDLGSAIAAQCCTYAPGGCAPAPYTCKTYNSKRGEFEVEEVEEIEEIEEIEQVEEVTEAEQIEAEPEFAEYSSASSLAYSFVFLSLALALIL